MKEYYKVTDYRTPLFYYEKYGADRETPRSYIACFDVSATGELGRGIVLEPQDELSRGELVWLNQDEWAYDLAKLSKDEVEDYRPLAEQLERQWAEAPYEIRGVFYGETDPNDLPDSWHQIERYDEQTWVLYNMSSLDDAKKWLLEMHPDYYAGANIFQKGPAGGGDFSMGAIPGLESDYTWQERRENARAAASRLGVPLGPVEHDKKGHLIEQFYYDVRTVPEDKEASDAVYTDELHGGSTIPGNYSLLTDEEAAQIRVVPRHELPEEEQRLMMKVEQNETLSNDEEIAWLNSPWTPVPTTTYDVTSVKEARAAVVEEENQSRVERAWDM